MTPLCTLRRIISVFIFVAVIVAVVLYRPVPALAVSTVTITPARDGTFLLRGIGIENAAAFDITVLYDADTRAKLRVVEGPLIAGAMTAINTKVRGTVRIVIIRVTPISGSGVIATLIFDRSKGAAPGNMSVLKARIANTRGESLPVLVQVNDSSD